MKPVFALLGLLVSCASNPPPPSEMLGTSAAGNAPAQVAPSNGDSPPATASPSASSATASQPQGDMLDRTGDVCGGDRPSILGQVGPGAARAKVSIREGSPSVNGRLARETIEKVVHDQFPRMRECYDGATGTKASVGRVVVGFVIDAAGKVTLSKVNAAGSTVSEASVSTCVAHSFCGMSFPAPDSGVVTVNYPLDLSISP
jgi:hypothetical protein